MRIKKIIIFVAIVIATITSVSCDSAHGTNFTTVSANFHNSSDGENVVNESVEVPEEKSEIAEKTTIIATETEISVNNENETEAEIETTTETEIETRTETDIETPEVLLKNVDEDDEPKNIFFLKENTTIKTTVTNATVPSPPLNFTTIKTTTDRVKPDDKKPSLLSSFNLNYLYLLLLIIPIPGIFIFICWYCKKKRKPAGYIEPQAQKTKRLSTPSWVFSEPDSQDEEITTLEEEKKL